MSNATVLPLLGSQTGVTSAETSGGGWLCLHGRLRTSRRSLAWLLRHVTLLLLLLLLFLQVGSTQQVPLG